MARSTAADPGAVRPGRAAADPERSSLVVDIIANRLQAHYKNTRLDHIACQMWIGLATLSEGETVEPPLAHARAVRALSKLIDLSVHLLDAEFDGEELKSITLSREVAEKMAGATGSRER